VKNQRAPITITKSSKIATAKRPRHALLGAVVTEAAVAELDAGAGSMTLDACAGTLGAPIELLFRFKPNYERRPVPD